MASVSQRADAKLAGTIQSMLWCNHVPRAEIPGRVFGVAVARGIVDHENLIRRRPQMRHGCQASAQERRPISCTDHDSDRHSAQYYAPVVGAGALNQLPAQESAKAHANAPLG